MKILKFGFLSLLLSIISHDCFSVSSKNNLSIICSRKLPLKTLTKDTTIIIDSIAVDIQFPEKNIEGFILMLPGWNFSKTDCCDKSVFCKKAKKAGYCLIMPEMGKSIYSGQLYKETRRDWRKYPLRTWITDKMIPVLQKNYGFLLEKGNNHLYGISTGARGVALLALYAGNIFKSGVALSGDFDQSVLNNDNLMIGYYGTFKKFPERWNGGDNAQKNAAKIKIPLYLAHGKKDKVAPVSQTEVFFKELQKLHPDGKHEIHINEHAEHNYQYWDSETDNALHFFLKNK